MTSTTWAVTAKPLTTLVRVTPPVMATMACCTRSEDASFGVAQLRFACSGCSIGGGELSGQCECPGCGRGSRTSSEVDWLPVNGSQGATNPQGASNMQGTNEQTGMLRDAEVAGAVGAGAGSGAGYMAGRNQVLHV
jgi:hypothetical protein